MGGPRGGQGMGESGLIMPGESRRSPSLNPGMGEGMGRQVSLSIPEKKVRHTRKVECVSHGSRDRVLVSSYNSPTTPFSRILDLLSPADPTYG